MQLSNEQIKDFQDLYEKNFGIKIGRDVAIEEGMKLVRLMQIVYQPITQKDLESVQHRLDAIRNQNL